MNNLSHRFEAMFNYATIGIVVTDQQGVIVDFNHYAESQFGYTRDEAIGRSVEILIPLNLHRAHVGHREAFYKHPEPRKMGEGRDLFARKKDGTEFPMEVSLSYYSIGGEMFVIAFVIDITVRKRSEALVLQQNADLERVSSEMLLLNTQLEQKVDDRTRMLRETLAELELSKQEIKEALELEKELSELKSRFVTTASHEFRTPLSTILSSAYLLEQYNPEEYKENLVLYKEKRAKHIHRIKSAVAGMKSILEDFLSLGKLEEGKVEAQIEDIPAPEALDELTSVVGELEHLLKSGQEIIFEHTLEGKNLRTDIHLLKNILSNLVSNAIKFSLEDKIIHVAFRLYPGMLSLSIRDNGIGISREDQEHLLERFFRARNAANIQGTGLGLHIIGKYLELLNGTIKIESVLNEGSTFTVLIPQPD